MRISDWSSDVCSSDLLLVEFARQRCDAAHEGAGDAQYVDFRQDCFLNSEAGVSRSPPRTHTSPRPWSLPGSGFARPAIVTDFMSSAPESTSLCSAIPCYVPARSEEHTSELQSLMRISYAVFCLKKKITTKY